VVVGRPLVYRGATTVTLILLQRSLLTNFQLHELFSFRLVLPLQNKSFNFLRCCDCTLVYVCVRVYNLCVVKQQYRGGLEMQLAVLENTIMLF